MKHYRRGFLNENEGLAIFETEVRTSNEWRDDQVSNYMNAGITLSDCSRRIYLEFEVGSEEELEQRTKKIKHLLSVVQEFHDKFMEGAASLTFKEEV